jgi:hypothetical protein
VPSKEDSVHVGFVAEVLSDEIKPSVEEIMLVLGKFSVAMTSTNGSVAAELVDMLSVVLTPFENAGILTVDVTTVWVLSKDDSVRVGFVAEVLSFEITPSVEEIVLVIGRLSVAMTSMDDSVAPAPSKSFGMSIVDVTIVCAVSTEDSVRVGSVAEELSDEIMPSVELVFMAMTSINDPVELSFKKNCCIDTP